MIMKAFLGEASGAGKGREGEISQVSGNMADEAAVENLPVNRFFCHKCSSEVTGVLADFTCPNCQCGFIEELEDAPAEPIDESDSEMEDIQPLDVLSDILMGFAAPEERRGRGRRSGGRMRARHIAPLDNLLQEFMVNITGGFPGGTVGIGRGGNGPFLLLGNPGDYAWGREGLDSIITQLLNQMDTAGPPPLAKDKINEIPVVIITKEQVDTNLQCSVCWEDFKAEEPVRKLPCEHVYHENCIIPWLELHGTCPICRKTLTDDGNGEPQETQIVLDNELAALIRATSDSSSSPMSASSSSSANSTSSSSSATSTSSSSSSGSSHVSSSNSSSSRPDFNVDMEFD